MFVSAPLLGNARERSSRQTAAIKPDPIFEEEVMEIPVSPTGGDVLAPSVG